MSENDPAAVEIPPRGQFLSEKMYDLLKWVAQIFLPAVGSLYFGLSDLWDLPKALEVVGTIALVDTFLGVLLGLSARQYNDRVVRSAAASSNKPRRIDGEITIDTVNVDKDVFQLEPYDGLLGLASNDKTEIVLKVNRVEGTVESLEADNRPLPGNDG